MQDDCIILSLGIPELQIVEQKELDRHLEITVMYRRRRVICPNCGTGTTKIQDRRPQRKQDRSVRDKAIFLILIKRRFRCLKCKKVFTEPDEVAGFRRRSTFRFRSYLGREALHQTVKRVAEKEKVGEGLVRRCIAEEVGRLLQAEGTPETPKVLGLDEFSVRRRHLYHTVICELVDKKVLAVIEGHGQKRLEEYLDTFPCPEKVKAVVMDMHEPFRQAVHIALPWTKIVVDKFHFLRQVNEALDRVRRRLQGGWRRRKVGDLFPNRYLLLKGRERLTEEESVRLSWLFHLYPELERAWRYKEGYRAWYQNTDRLLAEDKLKIMEEMISRDSLYEFKRLLSTLRNWRREILNYFDHPVTNGFVEGKNNRIKTIKRMAYGYRNPDNFRLRILATNLSYLRSGLHTY